MRRSPWPASSESAVSSWLGRSRRRARRSSNNSGPPASSAARTASAAADSTGVGSTGVVIASHAARVQHELHPARLVEEALDDERPLGRDDPERGARPGEVLDHLPALPP